MSKKSSLNRKQNEQDVETPKKRLIGIAIGVGALIVIAAIVYFAWPKAAPVTELKIEDLVVGTGREAKAGDTLTVEYTGWLQDKYNIQAFDSPNLHDKPFQFVLGNGEVVAGWDQGLVGMKVGGKRKLSIPPELAYGGAGAGNGRIPPNAALIFEVELLGLQGPPAATLPPSSVTELKIEDLVVGTGAAAKNGDTLSVHYTGWLENGTKFDSSLDSGQPIEFVLGQGRVIPGWEQGLVGMKVGGKRRLTIPSALGYGTSGAGDLIPPNATLIFEVELLAIK
jgi:FKBP-type peptidyl-prolyl cis-trans isomerase